MFNKEFIHINMIYSSSPEEGQEKASGKLNKKYFYLLQ